MDAIVTGMFDNGLIEVRNDSGKHEVHNINDLLADKKALDEMVKVYHSSDDATGERDGYHHVLAQRRLLVEED